MTRPAVRSPVEVSDLALCVPPDNTQRLLGVPGNRAFRTIEFAPRRPPLGAQVEMTLVAGYPKDWLRLTPVATDELELVQRPAVVPIGVCEWPTGTRQAPGGELHIEARLLPDKTQLADMKGMSGGPVVSIVRLRDGTTRPYLLGIQAAWVPETRRLGFAPVGTLHHALDTMWRLYRQYVASVRTTAPSARRGKRVRR